MLYSIQYLNNTQTRALHRQRRRKKEHALGQTRVPTLGGCSGLVVGYAAMVTRQVIAALIVAHHWLLCSHSSLKAISELSLMLLRTTLGVAILTTKMLHKLIRKQRKM
jgi:hypothetical protein